MYQFEQNEQKNIYHHITSTIKILIRNLHFMLEYHKCCDFIL